MLRPTIRLLIELDPESRQITGTVQHPPDSAPEPFHGWLQLTQLLEGIRTCGTPADGEKGLT